MEANVIQEPQTKNQVPKEEITIKELCRLLGIKYTPDMEVLINSLYSVDRYSKLVGMANRQNVDYFKQRGTLLSYRVPNIGKSFIIDCKYNNEQIESKTKSLPESERIKPEKK